MKPKPAANSAFGLIAWLEKTRVALPLKGVECRFDVTAGVANVELDQIYHQDATKPLDCTYTFPLPAGAAVYRCEVHVNGRIIRARVQSREEAVATYGKQKEAGHRAALVEVERENLFTLSLGNLQPGDLVVVRFSWFQVLDRSADRLRLSVPTCPGVRYIPGQPLLRSNSGKGVTDDTDQVPDASRLNPPQMDALHPDAAYFWIEGTIPFGDTRAGAISSPTHAVMVKTNEDRCDLELARGSHVPDRDFVLEWQEAEALATASQAWSWSEGKETYALVQLRAPARVEVAEGYEQDVYFLVDRSGSMQGAKWTCTCQALRSFVELLGAQDRVWITLFSTDFRDFAEAPLPASAVLRDSGFHRMERIGVDGGTELLPAASHVLQKIGAHSTGRRASVILITDGQVGNEAAVKSLFRRVPDVRVHAFGIDTAVNDAFLKSLAKQQRGGCWLQTPNDDIRGSIASLADRLRRPVLTDLCVEGDWDVAGRSCPDLHGREVAMLPLRGHPAESVVLKAMNPNQEEQRMVIPLRASSSAAIRLLWARDRIAALLAEDKQEEAIELAKAHNLLCEGAAFVAWDESESVVIAREEVVQPVMENFRCLAAPGAPISQARRSMRRGSWDDDGDALGSFAPLSDRLVNEDRLRGFFQRDPLTAGALRRDLIAAGIAEALADQLIEQMKAENCPDKSAFAENARQLGRLRQGVPSGRLRELVDELISGAAFGTPLNFFREAEVARRWTLLARGLRAIFPNARMHEPLILLILALALEHRSIEPLLEALSSMEKIPFSERAALRAWSSFLQQAVGSDEEGKVLVEAWERDFARTNGVQAPV